MHRERLEDLILRHLEGELTPEEARELGEAIAKDAARARLLRELADQDLLLSEQLGRPVPAFIPPAPSRLSALTGCLTSLPAPAKVLTAAAALVLCAVAVWLLVPTAGPSFSLNSSLVNLSW